MLFPFKGVTNPVLSGGLARQIEPLGFGRLMAIHAVGRNEAQPVLIRPRLIGSCNESQQAAEHSRAKAAQPVGTDIPPGRLAANKSSYISIFQHAELRVKGLARMGGKGIMGLIKNDPLHEGVVEGR